MDVELLTFAKNIKDFIKKNRRRRVFLIPHEHADVDAISSCVIMQDLLLRMNITSTMLIESMNSQSKILKERFSFSYEDINNVEISKEDILILLDVSSLSKLPQRIRDIIKKQKYVLLIDHHYGNNIIPLSTFHYVKKETSTTKIIFYLYSALFPITKNVAIFAIAGILSDTGYLRYATTEDLSIVWKLLQKYNLELREFSFLYKSFEDIDKGIKMKALKRLKIKRVKDVWVGFTFIGSEESKIANLFLQLGVDIAIVVNHKSYRLSIRYNHTLNLIEKDIIKRLSSLGLECGGHETVIGCKYSERYKDIISLRDALFKVLEEII